MGVAAGVGRTSDVVPRVRQRAENTSPAAVAAAAATVAAAAAVAAAEVA